MYRYIRQEGEEERGWMDEGDGWMKGKDGWPTTLIVRWTGHSVEVGRQR